MPGQEKRPLVTVDTVLFTLSDDGLAAILQPREAAAPDESLGLVGGSLRLDLDADTTEAATRIIAQRTHLTGLFIEQLATFSGPARDPRGWSVSVAHYALVPKPALARAAKGLVVVPADKVPPLMLDHNDILDKALLRIRRKGSWSNLPAFLLPERFTLPELKSVYEAVMGETLNDSAFRRKIGDLRIVEEVPYARRPATAERRRPAQLYRLARRALVGFDRVI